ncbi:hypothetical protein GFY24_37835 [Nocardia sp. SYP-A9097]|uniref:Rv1733c family protein n=1 Tax=Nocardia sp. SYP-A9097 TaxID=2663237 RepID=UPI00129B3345|nr:hypothetical protein [Nocardia sp. SYP-A9097]MRH93118.1 hypothetical protein [Nocardia sp. SYP-A9097]
MATDVTGSRDAVEEVVQVSESPAASMRVWRVRPWNPNPLMRVSDRVEVVVRALAAVAVAVAIPVSGAIGTVSYTGAQARIAAQDAGKEHVDATLTGEVQRLPAADRYGVHQDRYQAPATWNHDGHIITATIDVTGPQAAGSTVPLWIGGDGNPTIEPARPGAAAAEGIGTGLAVLVESWCAAAASVWITGTVLDARRNARLEREWRMMNRPIGKDTL